jgi:hypothetical protein
MAILGNLLGGLGLGRRQLHGGMWSRGGRGRALSGRGYGRTRIPHYFGGSLGRMTLGGLAAWMAHGFIGRRYRA